MTSDNEDAAREWPILLVLAAAVFGTILAFSILTLSWMPWVPVALLFVLLFCMHKSKWPRCLADLHIKTDPIAVGFVAGGGVIIGLFGFRPASLWFYVGPFENWHHGAVLWACVLSMYWLSRLHGILRSVVYVVLLWLAVVMIAAATLFSSGLPLPLPLIVFAMAIACFSVLLSSSVCLSLPPESRHAQRAKMSLFLCDLPTLLAFGVLWLYQRTGPGSFDERQAFVCGAISFQLLAAKAVFVVIESGVFDSAAAHGAPKGGLDVAAQKSRPAMA